MTLKDSSPMPFGKYLGLKMENVPASYLIWLWDNDDGLWHEPRQGSPTSIPPFLWRDGAFDPDTLGVRDYIVRNFHALETECPDKIIEHRP